MNSGGWRASDSRSVVLVLRVEALRVRLLKLEEVISRLTELSDVVPDSLGSDYRNAWAVERGLQLAGEILFDVGNHILSAHYGISAEGFEDIVAQLARQGVIDAELRRRLKGLGGFRNILVHDYLRLDPARVEEQLAKAPRDFSEFARAVRSWLERLDES
jgi:uncharacterized protein YutE (UPF0331/DUF86 family)